MVTHNPMRASNVIRIRHPIDAANMQDHMHSAQMTGSHSPPNAATTEGSPKTEMQQPLRVTQPVSKPSLMAWRSDKSAKEHTPARPRRVMQRTFGGISSTGWLRLLQAQGGGASGGSHRLRVMRMTSLRWTSDGNTEYD